MAKDALWIGAFLQGCKTVLQEGFGLSETEIKIQPDNNGAPYGGYRGTQWFFGLYFGGATWFQGQSQSTFSLNLALGVDVTRIWSRGPTRDSGEQFMRQGEWFSRIARTCELLMQDRSVVARACQDAYDEMLGGSANRDGLFRECFDRPNIMTPRSEGPEWLAAVPNENVAPETIFVCSLSFSGIKFHKLHSEIAQ